MRIDELTNVIEVDNIAKQIVRDCQPYLKAIGNDVFKYQLWRGTMTTTKKVAVTINLVPDRPPMDTPQFVHEIADKFFMETTGVKYRSNSIFCTGDKSEAETYGSDGDGTELLLFPIGNFKFCWSPVYSDFYHAWESIFPWKPEYNDDAVEYAKGIYDFLRKGDYRTNGLTHAIESMNEVMLHCPKCIGLNASSRYLKPILKMIKSA